MSCLPYSRPARLWITGLVTLVLVAATGHHESPEPILVSGASGGCYAKSVPADALGRGANTRIFWVGIDEDRPIHRFNWYSADIAVGCRARGPRNKSAISVVRMGHGWKATLGDNPRSVTLAFYVDARLVAEYSRTEIALLPGSRRIKATESWRGYYRPIGYRNSGARHGFEICTLDGRILHFDISSGEVTANRRYSGDDCERHDPREGEKYRNALAAYY